MKYQDKASFKKANYFGTGIPNFMLKGNVYIPAGVKHWHGAKQDQWFSHLSIEVPGENCSNEWLEPVIDSAYQKL